MARGQRCTSATDEGPGSLAGCKRRSLVITCVCRPCPVPLSDDNHGYCPSLRYTAPTTSETFPSYSLFRPSARPPIGPLLSVKFQTRYTNATLTLTFKPSRKESWNAPLRCARRVIGSGPTRGMDATRANNTAVVRCVIGSLFARHGSEHMK